MQTNKNPREQPSRGFFWFYRLFTTENLVNFDHDKTSTEIFTTENKHHRQRWRVEHNNLPLFET